MNGRTLFLDTNILLYFLNGDPNVFHFILDNDPVISFVTELEILSAPDILPSGKLAIQTFLKEFTILEYSERYKPAIIDIRSTKKLKLPDAIIAGTALTVGIPLVTADKKLSKVEGIDIIMYNPNSNE